MSGKIDVYPKTPKDTNFKPSVTVGQCSVQRHNRVHQKICLGYKLLNFVNFILFQDNLIEDSIIDLFSLTSLLFLCFFMLTRCVESSMSREHSARMIYKMAAPVNIGTGDHFKEVSSLQSSLSY